MLNPDLRDLLQNKTSRYSLVTAVAKRARVVSETPELNEKCGTEKPVTYALDEFLSGKLKIVENGMATDYSEEFATEILSKKQVTAIADIKQGSESATAWGCDLTFDYVKINADYRS